MTRDEAIIFLNDISWGMGSMAMESWNDKTGAKVREAIEALGTETCTITTYIDGKEAKSQGIYLMQWVPVSERLPEKNVEVLTTTESGYVTMAERLVYDDWAIHEGSSNAHTDELTAWMPLPEPYKAESEGGRNDT